MCLGQTHMSALVAERCCCPSGNSTYPNRRICFLPPKVIQFTQMEPAIQVEDLVKRFASFTAVDGISLAVKRGEIFGILGPNGAGKTTTLEIIEGLQKPTQGKVTVLGLDILKDTVQIKARIGVQLQSSAYFNYLSLKEILVLLASFYPKSLNPDELLDQVGLKDKSRQRIKELSGGQVQRFTVAASLINDPELVILDEPTTGLDPQARHNLWELIRDIHDRNVTVVLTTHYMDEAEHLADHIALMSKGVILSYGTVSEIISKEAGTILTFTVKDAEQVLYEGLKSLASFQGDFVTIKTDTSIQILHELTSWALDQNQTIHDLRVKQPTLEQVYLDIIMASQEEDKT